jgi:hypothetical protein
MNEIRLENWSVVTDADPYKAPEQLVSRLHGQAFGHPRFADGSEVTTSRVMGCSESKDHLAIVTGSGSHYVLGEVDPDYEERYPNARERFWKSLLVLEVKP